MKSKKPKPEAAIPSPKGKVKIKNLKLNKETIEDLSDHDAGLVKGGITTKCPKDNSAGSGVTVMQCWVARAVYGEDNPRWLLFRDWLTQDSPAWSTRCICATASVSRSGSRRMPRSSP